MVEKGKNNETGSPEVSLKELDEDECEGNNFSSYHLHKPDESNVHLDVEHFNCESLYHVDENIDDLSDLDDEFDKTRQPNIQEQVFGLRNNAWTLMWKKEQSKLKEGRNERLVIVEVTRRIAKFPLYRLKLQNAGAKMGITSASSISIRRGMTM
uniref:Transposon MuDR mudrA n=1 Tax=Solanum tuberosum TaxID=4113 RepID=M1DSL4_SOLTU